MGRIMLWARRGVLASVCFFVVVLQKEKKMWRKSVGGWVCVLEAEQRESHARYAIKALFFSFLFVVHPERFEQTRERHQAPGARPGHIRLQLQDSDISVSA